MRQGNARRQFGMCDRSKRTVRLMVPVGTGEYRTNRQLSRLSVRWGTVAWGKRDFLAPPPPAQHITQSARSAADGPRPPHAQRAPAALSPVPWSSSISCASPPSLASRACVSRQCVAAPASTRVPRPRQVRHARKPQTKGRRPYSRHSLRFWIRVAPRPRRRARLPHQRQRLVRIERQLRVRRLQPPATPWPAQSAECLALAVAWHVRPRGAGPS